MAEALFKARAREQGRPLSVGSAGTAAMLGYPAPEEAIKLLDERGLDIRAHRGRQIVEPMVRGVDLVLVMEAGQRTYIGGRWPNMRGRVYRLGERRKENVRDPYRGSIKDFRISLAQIEDFMNDWDEILFS